MIDLEIKIFNELTGREVYEILRARSEVFMIGQNFICHDEDGKDIEAVHLMIKKKEKVIAYLRILKTDVSYKGAASIGRVLVTKEARRRGLAKQIVQAAVNYIFNDLNEEKITIGAQEYLRDFYISFGFKAISDIYIENNIPHIDMTINRNNL